MTEVGKAEGAAERMAEASAEPPTAPSGPSVWASSGGSESAAASEASEASKCPVCLVSPMSSPAKPDACDHRFCLDCIKEWSALKAVCPLCKAAFSRVELGDGRSWAVPAPAPGEAELARRFGYRSALSGERLLLFEHISRMQADVLSVARRLADQRDFVAANSGNPSMRRQRPDFALHAARRLRETTQLYRARDQDLRLFQALFAESERQPRHALLAHPSFRRFLYTRGVRVRPMEEVETPEERRGVREASAAFFAANPAASHRLQPLLALDLSVLLQNRPHKVQEVLARVMGLLLRFDISSADFRGRLAAALGAEAADFADQLAHELHHFARSPDTSLEEYFRHAVYHNDDDEIAALRSARNSAGPDIEVVGGAIRPPPPVPPPVHVFPPIGTFQPAFPEAPAEGGAGAGPEGAEEGSPSQQHLSQLARATEALNSPDLMDVMERTRERMAQFASHQAAEEYQAGTPQFDARLQALRDQCRSFERLRRAMADEDVEGIPSDRVLDLPSSSAAASPPERPFPGSSRAVQRIENLLRRARRKGLRPTPATQASIHLSDSEEEEGTASVQFLGEAGAPVLASASALRRSRSQTPDAPITSSLRETGQRMAAAIAQPPGKKCKKSKKPPPNTHLRWSPEPGEGGEAGPSGSSHQPWDSGSAEWDDSRAFRPMVASTVSGGRKSGFLARLARAVAPPGPFARLAQAPGPLDSELFAEDLRVGARFSASPSPERRPPFHTPTPELYPPIGHQEEVVAGPSTGGPWDDLSGDDSDLEVVADMKPKHLRTPPTVTLGDEDEEPGPSTSQAAQMGEGSSGTKEPKVEEEDKARASSSSCSSLSPIRKRKSAAQKKKKYKKSKKAKRSKLADL